MAHVSSHQVPNFILEKGGDHFARTQKVEWIIDTLAHRSMVLDCLRHSIDHASEHDLDKIYFALSMPDSHIKKEGHILEAWKTSGIFSSHVSEPDIGSKHHSQNILDAAGFMEMLADWKAAATQRGNGCVRPAPMRPNMIQAMTVWDFTPHYDVNAMQHDWFEMVHSFRMLNLTPAEKTELAILCLQVDATLCFIRAYINSDSDECWQYTLPHSLRTELCHNVEPSPLMLYCMSLIIDGEEADWTQSFYYFLADAANRYLSLDFWNDTPADVCDVVTTVKIADRSPALTDFSHEILT